MTNTYCCVYSVETPDDGQWTCTKYVEFFTKINLRNSASRWLLLQEFCIKYRTLLIGMRIKQKLLFPNTSEKASAGHTDCGS
jgi:hypothetical protein